MNDWSIVNWPIAIILLNIFIRLNCLPHIYIPFPGLINIFLFEYPNTPSFKVTATNYMITSVCLGLVLV